MAHKKAGGSTRNGRDSHSKRLGVKIFGGEQVLAGNIIVRQARHQGAGRRKRRASAPITRCSRSSTAAWFSAARAKSNGCNVSVQAEAAADTAAVGS